MRRINLQYNWSEITTSSYLTLIELNMSTYPIPPNKIKCKDVIIMSYQKYANLAGCSISDITCGHELDDAFFLSGLRPNLKMILYNKEKYDSRLKHTLWHEVGHIKCNHQKHGENEEIEAHFFAAQANAPNVLIKALSQRGYTINASFLMQCFGLSAESANKKIDYLQKYNFSHSNEYDDIILQQFNNFLDLNYPPKTKHFDDNYYDDLEQEREKWK